MYDKELYALPSVDEMPTATTSTKELMMWKCIVIARSVTSGHSWSGKSLRLLLIQIAQKFIL